jgi:hypothetical protein
MVNISDRWNLDKTSDLQFAFFNGVGWESWENVWGIWIGINPRDAEATRRVATIERAVAPFLVSLDWEPLYPMANYGIYSSRWPLGNDVVWTIVNRANYSINGRQMDVPYSAGMRYFDLYHGVELKPELKANGQTAVLRFDMEAFGYGAILATPSEPSETIKALMSRMAAMTKKPLAEFAHEPPILHQTLVDIAPTKAATEASEGMIRIPGGSFRCVEYGRCAVSMGRHAAPFSRSHARDQDVLHRQIPRHQCAVQKVSRRHPLRAARQDQFSARLAKRHVSDRLGQSPRHLGVA